MKLETIACNNCGAPLQVPATANFVTCNHCRSHLAVRRNESVTFTEKLDRLAQQTDRLVDEVARIAYQNRIATIDRQWERERERYYVTDKHGRRHVPTAVGSVVGAVFVVGVGLFWTIMAANMPGSGPFPLFGLLFIAFGLVVAFVGWKKSEEYRAALRQHRRWRQSVSFEEFRRQFEPGAEAAADASPSAESYLADLERRDRELRFE